MRFEHLARGLRETLCCNNALKARVIPPNGFPGLEALSSTLPLVILRRINKASGVLIDVVKEPETLTAVASKKSLLPSNKQTLS